MKLTEEQLQERGELLQKLQDAVASSDDEHSEDLLDREDFDYKEISGSGWECDGKYDTSYNVYKINGYYFGFSESRSGSYHSDYYHQIDEVRAVEKFEGYTRVITDDLDDEMLEAVCSALDVADVAYEVKEVKGWD